MTERRFHSFDEFWPFYVEGHRHPLNRALHYVGTSLGLASLATGVIARRPLLILAAPILGYGPAWIGHFFVEGNRPASFKHPLWSFRADLKMLGLALRGRMGAEVERICGRSDENGASTIDQRESRAA